MVERLSPVMIDVPAELRQRAGAIVVDAIREAGIDPHKALQNPMIQLAVQAWGSGEYTKANFLHVCGLALSLNPSLALEVRR